jgi:hypothetical protein
MPGRSRFFAGGRIDPLHDICKEIPLRTVYHEMEVCHRFRWSKAANRQIVCPTNSYQSKSCARQGENTRIQIFGYKSRSIEQYRQPGANRQGTKEVLRATETLHFYRCVLHYNKMLGEFLATTQ